MHWIVEKDIEDELQVVNPKCFKQKRMAAPKISLVPKSFHSVPCTLHGCTLDLDLSLFDVQKTVISI